MEDFIDKINIVPCGQQNAVHHVVDMLVLLLNATQTGITGPSIRQRAAVRVALFCIPWWSASIPISTLIFLLLLAATACSDSLPETNGERN